MSAFPQLSNADIDNIIAYTSEPKLKLLLHQLVVLAVPGPAVLTMVFQIILF
jgi:hypothetical protein